MKRKILSAITSSIMAITLLGGGATEITKQSALINEPLTASAAGEAVAISSVEGMPGETVTVEIHVACNDNLEAIDIVLGFDSDLNAGMVAGNDGIICSSAEYEDSLSVVCYGSGPIADGVVATVDFQIPANAEIGTVYDISIDTVNTFAVFGGEDLYEVVPCSSGSIEVVADDSSINSEKRSESISLSHVQGKPGETVTVEINVACNDNLESIDIALGFDSALTAEAAKGANGVSCASTPGNDNVTVVCYGSQPIADGVVATVDFTIPEDAEIGTIYDIYFDRITTFSIFGGDDIGSAVNSNIGSIEVIDDDSYSSDDSFSSENAVTLEKGINEFTITGGTPLVVNTPAYETTGVEYFSILTTHSSHYLVDFYFNDKLHSQFDALRGEGGFWHLYVEIGEEDIGGTLTILISDDWLAEGETSTLNIAYGDDGDGVYEEKTLEELENCTLDVPRFGMGMVAVELEEGVYEVNNEGDSLFFGQGDSLIENKTGTYALEAGTYYFHVIPGTDYSSESDEVSFSVKKIDSGDVTGDSATNLYDAIEICRYIMEMRSFTEAEMKTADYNGDSYVNLYDVIEIAKFMMSQP